MFTRGHLVHSYAPQPPGMMYLPGAMRVETVKGIVQTWAVSRPVACYNPYGTPFYIQGNVPDCGNRIERGGTFRLTPARPNVEMDPSDQSTWQRPYRF